MSTRSNISIQDQAGNIKSIYCHYDGYLDHNGKILNEFYNTEEKVNELINLGGISSLGETISSTVAYHRDRKERLVITRTSSIRDITDQDYNYLFKDNAWHLLADNDKAVPLSELITVEA